MSDGVAARLDTWPPSFRPGTPGEAKLTRSLCRAAESRETERRETGDGDGDGAGERRRATLVSYQGQDECWRPLPPPPEDRTG